jgi:integrase
MNPQEGMMKPQFNPENERIKRDYLDFVRHCDGKSEQTIRQVEAALRRYESFTNFEDFRRFDSRHAREFKDALQEDGLSLATVHATLRHLQRFLTWLARQPGFKRAIREGDIAYLNLPANESRAAAAPADRPHPSLEMTRAVIGKMPVDTAIARRDRAIITLLALTGVRDGALISLRLKDLDLSRKLLLQDPRSVSTKFGKRIDTFLFPFGEDLEAILEDWVGHLRTEQLFADHDPLFPATEMGHDAESCFTPVGLSRERWRTAGPVRKIVRDAFREHCGRAFTPHAFRNMIVAEMYRRQLSVAACKAWSQNLGHEGAMTTLTSYGKLSFEEQGRLVRANQPRANVQQPVTRDELVKILAEIGIPKGR